MAAQIVFLYCLLGATFCATIPRDIPVEVRYEGANAVRNLDAKVQLSPEELGQSLKHLPLQEPLAASIAKENAVQIAQVAARSPPTDAYQPSAQSSQAPLETSQPSASSVKPSVEPSQPLVESSQTPFSPVPPLAEYSQPLPNSAELPVESSQPTIRLVKPIVEFPSSVASSQPSVDTTQPAVESSVGGTLESKLQQLRTTVIGELKRLRNSFRPSTGESAPDGEQWASLERQVDELFEQQRGVIYNRQAAAEVGGGTQVPAGQQNNNIFQNIINGMTQLTSGWVANIQNNNKPPTGTQGDEGTNNQGSSPGGFQGFVQYFTNGVNNIMNQITNNNGPTTSNTVLGDSGVANPPSNNPLAAVGGFFSSVANNVQQVFNGQNNSPPGTQGDTGSNSGPPSPIQAIQNFGNSVSSAINNIFQGQQPPAAVSGDEGVPANGGSNVNIIQSIGNAISNSPLNPFRPQSNSAQKPVQAVQASAIQAPAQPPSADNSQKQPAEVTPVIQPVVDVIVVQNKPEENLSEETQNENEIDGKAETLVNKNSLAEECGLQVGDLIVRINESNTTRLTHSEVHDLITSSGLNFILGIRRGIVSIDIINEGELSLEFQDILKGIETSVEEDIFAHAANLVEKLNEENLRRNKLTENTTVNRKKKMVFSNATQTLPSLEDEEKAGKFSTFMMKPDIPIPNPKRKNEEINQEEQESYKVVIKRQPLGRKFFKEKKVQFDQNVTEMEIEAVSETTDDISQEINMDEIERFNGHADIRNIEETHEDYGDIIEEEFFEDNEVNGHLEKDMEENGEPQEIKYKSLSEIRVDTSEFSMTLEERLLAVQKQLQALSQLPSAIQMTLDAVSKQLASIVSAKENSEEKDGREPEKNHDNGMEDGSDEDREGTDEMSEDEVARAETTQGQNGASNSSLEGDFDDDSLAEEEIKAILERARLEECEEIEEVEKEQAEEISEENLVAQMREQEMLAKKRQAMECREAKPIQRPIILPGGRKWSNPEDAMPTFRKPKMSEEKIIETIEGSLETIAGKRKGINFLKFQPPPKNLDYLQRSEVYRLVHDMEPPVRGIVSRPEKVLPEQDYYEASKGAP